MALNLNELQQRVDRAIHNADEFVRKWIEFLSAPAGTVTLEYYDRNGNLQTVTFSNRSKLVQDFIANVNNVLSKEFYVDQINGNDTNDGTATSPLQNIQTAINKAPPSGRVRIHIIGDYTLDHDVIIENKYVELILYGTLNVPVITKTFNNQQYAYIPGFIILNSALVIRINSENNGKIVVQPNNTGVATFAPFGLSPIKVSERSSFSSVTISLRVVQDNYHPIEVYSGYLISYFQWGFNGTGALLSISGHYGGTNRGIVIASSASGFAQLPYAKPALLYIRYEGGFQDENGTAVDVKTKIAGIVKDANGVPRNVISNLIL